MNELENSKSTALNSLKKVGVDVTCGIQLPKLPEKMSNPESLCGYMLGLIEKIREI
jgi:hypothetical protein